MLARSALRLGGCKRQLVRRQTGSPAVWQPRPSMAKIVATIGPASEQLPVLQQVVTAGMRIMRINFSHATFEEADLRVKNLKLSSGRPHLLMGERSPRNLRAVMLDTQGPEIRTGSFEGVKEVLRCSLGSLITSLEGGARER